MPNLIESAPKDETAAGDDAAELTDKTAAEGAAAEPAPKESGKLPRKPVDLDARMEELLAESRKTADAQKTADATMKAAKELEAKYSPYAKLSPERLERYAAIEEHLTKKDRAKAIQELLQEQLDEDLLFDLAPVVKPRPALTVEEQVAKALAERDAVAEKKKDEEAAAKATVQAEANATELKAYMTRSGAHLKANVDRFPFIQAWGCDDDKYRKLSIDYIVKHDKVPEPDEILQQIEDEHRAHWKKSPGAPREPEPLTLEEHVAETYERHRPPGPKVVAQDEVLSPADQARAELDAFDKQRRGRIRWGA